MASVIPSAPLGTDAAAAPFGLGAASAESPGGTGAKRRFRFELAAHPASPAQARRLTRARLTGWSVGEDTCDSATLVVSELVTNAVLHTASTHIVCELHDGADLVRIAVRDEGCAPGEPRPACPRSEEEHGRGLFLVDALCQAWGAQEHGPGLLVWAELRRGTANADAIPGPRGDLGWGARPKPGPSGGSAGSAGRAGRAEAHGKAAHGAFGIGTYIHGVDGHGACGHGACGHGTCGHAMHGHDTYAHETHAHDTRAHDTHAYDAYDAYDGPDQHDAQQAPQPQGRTARPHDGHGAGAEWL